MRMFYKLFEIIYKRVLLKLKCETKSIKKKENVSHFRKILLCENINCGVKNIMNLNFISNLGSYLLAIQILWLLFF